MSILSKTNLNEGHYIVGYKCDGCSVESYLPDLPFDWEQYEVNNVTMEYCKDCTYKCQSCGKNYYELHINENDVCNSCNEKHLELFEKFNATGLLIDSVLKFLNSLGKQYVQQEVDSEVKTIGIKFVESLMNIRNVCIKETHKE